MRYFALLIVVFVGTQSGYGQEVPLFSFGLIADVQYADADTWGKRDYRGSLKRLENSVDTLNNERLEFIVHVGDLIDRYYESFDMPLNIFGRSKATVHYVIGNHEFSIADSLKARVRERLNNKRGYYRFMLGQYQFILLDAMDVSVHASVKGTREYSTALTLQQDLSRRGANNAHDYNGAIGDNQLRWLRKNLRKGERRGYRTLLFCHLPLLPENGLQLWNNREVLELLERFTGIVAFVSGHHHDGNYVQRAGIHHLTLRGLVESAAALSCAVADVYPDRIVVRGFGDQPSYVLEY